MKKQKLKTIRICSKEYDLKFDNKTGGGTFASLGMGKQKGRGRIIIGTKYPDLQHVGQTLIHEALEAIFAEEDKRHEQWNSKDRNQYLFIFDHDYLSSLGPKLFDALKSCNFGKYLQPKKHEHKIRTKKRKKVKTKM